MLTSCMVPLNKLCVEIIIIKSMKKKPPSFDEGFFESGAGNETRTRDPNLGKVVLYQLSYSRVLSSFIKTYTKKFGAGNETRTRDPNLGKVVLYQLSYSRVLSSFIKTYTKKFGAGNETRTRDPNLGKVVLYQLSYSRIALYDTASKFRVNSFMKKLSLIA